MAKKTEAAQGARYAGDGGAWVPGVPMRDLTAEEWAALSDELRAQCLATGLYTTEQAGPAPAQEG